MVAIQAVDPPGYENEYDGQTDSHGNHCLGPLYSHSHQLPFVQQLFWQQ
jgi:hypothetical protein